MASGSHDALNGRAWAYFCEHPDELSDKIDDKPVVCESITYHQQLTLSSMVKASNLHAMILLKTTNARNGAGHQVHSCELRGNSASRAEWGETP